MFKLQIAFPDGRVVQFPAGGPIEAELVELIVSEVIKGGVGFKTTAHVEADIRDGVKTALYKFKENILSVPIRVQ